MAVITISRMFGSGGDEIAFRAADALGYRFFNKQMMEQAARNVSIKAQDLIDLSEDNYRIQNFIGRLLTGTAAEPAMEWGSDLNAAERCPEEEKALALVHKVIWSAYQMGGMVIVGRGGQMILRDQPDVLHVRIEAPLEQRVARISQRIQDIMHTVESDAVYKARMQAIEIIQERDESSAAYIRRFYGRDWSDPTLYHAVLNMGKITTQQAVQAIIDMVQNKELEPSRRKTYIYA